MKLVQVSYIVTIGVALLGLIVGGVRYTIKGVVALSRWLVLWEVIATQFKPNHGSSLVDRVATVEAAILEIRTALTQDEVSKQRSKGTNA